MELRKREATVIESPHFILSGKEQNSRNKQKLEEVLIMVERAGWRWGRLPRRRELKFLE